MPQVIFYIQAYNAEKTIGRALDSVINQTYEDWRCYCVNNGSADRTGEIIEEYAQKDKRILTIEVEKNNKWYLLHWLPQRLNEFHDGFYVNLDADDEYKPAFLERMLALIDKYHLDVAACGNDFIDDRTGDLLGTRRLKSDLVLDRDGFDVCFPQYHQFMRTVWGKIYALSVLRRCRFENIKKVLYGADTVFAMEAFRNAERVGILAESLHKYYISPKSASYEWDEKRISSDRVLFDTAHNFLISKYGSVSQTNREFLLLVYLNAIKDTMNVLINAQLGVLEKLHNLRNIFQSRQTQELIQWKGAAAQKGALFSQILSWVVSQREATEGKGLDLTVDIFVAGHLFPYAIGSWPEERMFMLLTKLQEKNTNRSLTEEIGKQITAIASKSPFLANSDIGFLMDCREIVASVLQNNMDAALEQVKSRLARKDSLSGPHAEPLLTLGLNLSAALKRADDFVAYKKTQIAWLINAARIEEAGRQLDDWDRIFPDDVDFQTFRRKLAE